MPLYTVITQEGSVSDETKAKIAEELTRIHTTVMNVPRSFVRAIFLSYVKGSGYTAGEVAPTAALNCVLRSGHTAEEKDGVAQTAVVNVPGSHRHRDGSTRDTSPGDPVQQCDGDGADHARSQPRVGTSYHDPAAHSRPAFGGVGNSGMGKYHGEWGFRSYTNARGVLYHGTRIDHHLRYPPYSS